MLYIVYQDLDPPIINKRLAYKRKNICKKHHRKKVHLINMASDLLSISIITMASKSTFSIGRCLLNKYMSHFLSRKVQTLICTYSWLHDFTPTSNAFWKYVFYNDKESILNLIILNFVGWKEEEKDENASMKDSNEPYISGDKEIEV